MAMNFDSIAYDVDRFKEVSGKAKLWSSKRLNSDLASRSGTIVMVENIWATTNDLQLRYL